MAAVALEEAANHVAGHFGIDRDLPARQRVQKVDQVGGIGIVGQVLAIELANHRLDVVLGHGAALQQGEQTLLLIFVMQGNIDLEGFGHHGRQGALEGARQAVGNGLQDIAQPFLAGVLVDEKVYRIGEIAWQRRRWHEMRISPFLYIDGHIVPHCGCRSRFCEASSRLGRPALIEIKERDKMT